jgi:hypothetical protein
MTADVQVQLVAGDTQERIAISYAAAMGSEFLKNTLNRDENDDHSNSDEDEVVVECPRVDAPALAKVVEFLNTYHAEPLTPWTIPVNNDSFELVRSFSFSL